MVELPKRLETALVAAQLSVDDFLTYFLYFSRTRRYHICRPTKKQVVNLDPRRALDF